MARAAPSSAASTVSSTRGPTRTACTPSMPRWARLPSTARPCGSRMPALRGDVDGEPDGCSSGDDVLREVALERGAGDPLERLDVAARGSRPRRRRAAPGPGAVLSHGWASSQSRTYCLSKLACARPGWYVGGVPEAGRVGRERPRRSGAARRSPRRRRTRTSCRRAGCPTARRPRRRSRYKREREVADPLGDVAADPADHRVEVDVLVVFADLGLGGRREDRLGQAVALAQAGRQRDAAHGPVLRGTPSSRSRRGSRGRRPRPAATSARRQTITRPRSVGRRSPASVESRWLGTIDRVSANQNRDRPVRTRPLSGMAVGSTTSNALIRSLATSSSRPSGRSYRSRTLPDRTIRVSGRHGTPRGRHERIEAVDDRVDVAQEGRLVEAGVEIGQRQVLRDVGIGGQEVAQRRPLVGGPERRALDDRVRLVAADTALLDERDQHPAAGVQSEAARDVLAHPLRPDDEALDETGHADEHVVEQDRGVGQDRPAPRWNG